MTDLPGALEELRRERYRQGREAKIRSAGEALQFVNQVGFCLLFRHKKLELPNLWEISEGRPWLWKDELPIQKQLYYGKRFRGRVGFVALRLLPSLYALSPTAELRGDRFELYRLGYLSAEANRIAGTVLAKGPLPTRALRLESGLAGQTHRYRFSRALAEAEEKFLVVKVGAVKTGHANYTYLWDSFARFWPEIVEEGAQLSHEEAGLAVIAQYVQTVAATTVHKVAYTFSLNEQFVGYFAGRLVEQGELERLEHEEVSYLVSPEAQPILREKLAEC
jgi:hypothetical protein